jgi:hypothetical protein
MAVFEVFRKEQGDMANEWKGTENLLGAQTSHM